MSMVSYDGASINYLCIGEGRDVVMIHGIAANHAFWRPEVLLPLARNYRVTVYDLRGHGYSGMSSNGYTSADMSKDLHHLLDHLGIQKAHLIGHSFGGTVALHFAVLHPDRVSSLTIAESRVRALQPTNRLSDMPNWETAKKSFEALGLFVPENETEVGLWFLERLASPECRLAKEKLKDKALFVPFSSWAGGNRSADKWLELLRTTTIRHDLISPAGLTQESLSDIQHPTLLLYGENSQLMSSFRGLRGLLPNHKNAIIPDAGHFFPLTQPKLFVAMVCDFLAKFAEEDRREYERLSFTFPVEIRENSGICFPAATVNVSMNGLLVVSARKLEVVSDVEVVVIPDQDDRKIVVRGRVVRPDERGPGNDYRLGLEIFSEGDAYLAWQNFLMAQTCELTSGAVVLEPVKTSA